MEDPSSVDTVEQSRARPMFALASCTSRFQALMLVDFATGSRTAHGYACNHPASPSPQQENGTEAVQRVQGHRRWRKSSLIWSHAGSLETDQTNQTDGLAPTSLVGFLLDEPARKGPERTQRRETGPREQLQLSKEPAPADLGVSASARRCICRLLMGEL